MRISPGLSGCMLSLFVATASAAPPVEKVSVSTLISHGIEPSASSAIDVELPELDQGADVEIVPDNLKAIATIYYSYQLEELKLFAVVDEIVRQFESGLIPVGSGDKDVLYRYTKNTGKRLSAATRARMYGHALGNGASPGPQPNKEFNPLWARFIEAVSKYESKVAKQTKLDPDAPVSQEELRRAARDLGQNLSNRGYGGSVAAAARLAQHVKDAGAVLSSPAIPKHYGATSSWEVVAKVAAKDLGGSPNLEALRAQALAGSRLLRWIATSARELGTATQKLPPPPPGYADLWKKVAAPSWKAKPAPPAGKPPVVALCFDAKLEIIPCKSKQKR